MYLSLSKQCFLRLLCQILNGDFAQRLPNNLREEQRKKVDGRTFRLFFLPVIHHKLHERRVMVKLATVSVSYRPVEGKCSFLTLHNKKDKGR